jgi:predicted RNase H-like nuclease (RuvC/YqgF family)
MSGLQRHIEDLEQQAQQLRRDVEQREVQLSAAGEEVEALRQREAELMQLQLDLKGRDERIQQLSQELERLKAIDMQRRPAPRP